jgi:hypothetical protein
LVVPEQRVGNEQIFTASRKLKKYKKTY